MIPSSAGTQTPFDASMLRPPAARAADELSDEELEGVAGGLARAWDQAASMARPEPPDPPAAGAPLGA